MADLKNIEESIKNSLKEVVFLQEALKGKIISSEKFTELELTSYYKNVANLGLIYLKQQQETHKTTDDNIIAYYEKIKELGLTFAPQTDYGKITKEYYSQLSELSNSNQLEEKVIVVEEDKDTSKYYKDLVTPLSNSNQLEEQVIVIEENKDTSVYYKDVVTPLSDSNQLEEQAIIIEENKDTSKYYKDEVIPLSNLNQLEEKVIVVEENKDTSKYYKDVENLSNLNQLSEVQQNSEADKETELYYNKEISQLSNSNQLEEKVIITEENKDTSKYYKDVENISDENQLDAKNVKTFSDTKKDLYIMQNTLLGKANQNKNIIDNNYGLKSTANYYKDVAKHAIAQKISFNTIIDKLKDNKLYADWGFHLDPSTLSFGGGLGVEYKGIQFDLSIQKYYGGLDKQAKDFARKNNIKTRYSLDDLTVEKKIDKKIVNPNNVTENNPEKIIKQQKEILDKGFVNNNPNPGLVSATGDTGKELTQSASLDKSKSEKNATNNTDFLDATNKYFSSAVESQNASESGIDFSKDPLINSNDKTYEKKINYVRDILSQKSSTSEGFSTTSSDKSAKENEKKTTLEINEAKSQKAKKLFAQHHPTSTNIGDNSSNSKDSATSTDPRTSYESSGLTSNASTFPKHGENISTQDSANGRKIANLTSYKFSGGTINKGFSVPEGQNPYTYGTPDVPTTKKLEEMLNQYRNYTPGSYKFFIEKLHGRHTNGDFYTKNPIKNGQLRSEIPNRMVFPAYIQSYNDSYTPEWSTQEFYGRSEKVGIYKSTSRQLTISFYMASDFSTEVLLAGIKAAKDMAEQKEINKDPELAKIAKKNKAEAKDIYENQLTDKERLEELRKYLPEWGSGTLGFPSFTRGMYSGIVPGQMTGTPEMLWSKLTFLAQCCYPWYRNDGKMKEQPIIRIRIGDFIDATGRITGLNVDDYENMAVDLNASKVGAMPMGVQVSLNIDIIHEDEPSSEYCRFYHRKDYDIEDIYYIPDCIRTDSQTTDSGMDPDPEDEALMFTAVEDLKINVDGLKQQNTHLNDASKARQYKKTVRQAQAVLNIQKEMSFTKPSYDIPQKDNVNVTSQSGKLIPGLNSAYT